MIVFQQQPLKPHSLSDDSPISDSIAQISVAHPILSINPVSERDDNGKLREKKEKEQFCPWIEIVDSRTGERIRVLFSIGYEDAVKERREHQPGLLSMPKQLKLFK